jgi:methylmalonyl-CoA mutase
LRLLDAARVPLEEARRRIAFRLAADADEFVTLSKFRALRLIWARVEEACGLEPRSAQVHAESAWRVMTARDPYVNVMRGAIAAFSAGLGGADSVSVLPHTLAVGLPDSLARRLARNGQLILLRESRLGFVADPAAGAGGFEALTGAFCEKAWTLFQEMEAEGGLPGALANGVFQRQVADGAAALKRDVARLRSPITGVSAHPDLSEPGVELASGAPAREASAGAEGALRPFRLAEPFEALRDASDAMLAKVGSRPKVYLVALGPEPSHRLRAAFIREWLEAGGIELVYEGEAATHEEAVKRMKRSGAPLACLCGDEAAYAAAGQTMASALKASGVRGLILAGKPGKAEADLRAAGIDAFIFPGADAVAASRDLYLRLQAADGSSAQ